MGTRSGDFDPAALQRLMHKTGMNIDEAVKVLNYKSGLLGISGISSDMRDLIESKDKRAKLARKINLKIKLKRDHKLLALSIKPVQVLLTRFIFK